MVENKFVSLGIKDLLKRLITNTGAMMIARGVQPLINLLFIAVISRTLGVKGFGEYVSILALYSIFELVASFGIRMLLTREIAKTPEQANTYLINGMAIVITIAMLNVLAMNIAIYFMDYNSSLQIAASVLSLSLIMSGIIECIIGLLAGFERLKIVALVTSSMGALRVIISILLLYQGYGILMIVIIFGIFKVLSGIALIVFVFKFVTKIRIRIDIRVIKKLLGEVHFFAFSGIFYSIYSQIDILLLSKICAIDDVGIYGAAARILRFAVLIIQSFFVAFYPILSKLYNSDRPKFMSTCYSAGKYLLIILIPFAFTITFFFDRIFILIFDESFTASLSVLHILIWLIVPFSIAKLFSFSLLASGRQKRDLQINIAITVIKFIVLFFLLKFYGYMGVGIGTVFAGLILVGLQATAVNDLIQLKLSKIVVPMTKLIFVSLAMLISILLLKPFGIIGTIVGSYLVYFALLYFLKLISPRDKYIIKQLLGMNKKNAAFSS